MSQFGAMAKAKPSRYDLPTESFPYKILKRFRFLATPKKDFSSRIGVVHGYTPRGIRKSALGAVISDRVKEIAWPPLRILHAGKKMYRHVIPPERMERFNKYIEASNGTMYSKLYNIAKDLKATAEAVNKKKRGWSESEWKKHSDYLSRIAGPKYVPEPDPIDRGPRARLDDLFPRIDELAEPRDFEDNSYKDPLKISPGALKYVPTERILKLAVPRVIPAAP